MKITETKRAGGERRARVRVFTAQTLTAAMPLPSAASRPDVGIISRGFTQVRVRCPTYLSDQFTLEQQQLRREGQRVTLNYIVLRALQKAGYHIEEADLWEDGRRLRR